MTWFKFLAAGAVGPFSGYRWPSTAASHVPGDWVTTELGLDPCRSGLHVCRAVDLPFWVHEELYVVEVDGPVTEYESFVLASRARLARRVPWDRNAAFTFSQACAWRVRDLAAEALERTGRPAEAHRLLGCTTLADLHESVGGQASGSDVTTSAVNGYVADVIDFAGGVEGAGWASAAATTAFVAAAAARATAPGGTGVAAWAAERRRQAFWIADLAER